MTTTLDLTVDASEVLAPDGYAMSVIRYEAQRLVERRIIAEADQDDLEQELGLRLLKRLPNFNPERARLNTFVAHAVRFEAREIARLRKAEKHVHRRNTQSLDIECFDAAGRRDIVGNTVTRSQQLRGAGRTVQDDHRQCELRLDIATVMAALPPDLRELCQKLLESNGRSAVPPKQLARLRRHFEATGLRDYL